MIRQAFQKLLYKSGKAYTVDPDIPERLILRTLYCRLMMLIRGVLFTQQKLYLGSGCSISNLGNISFGRNVTVEHAAIIDGYAKEKLVFADGVKIGAYCTISCTSHLSKFGKGISIGANSAFGKFCEFGASGGISIGSDVIMGSYVSFHSENHNFLDSSKLIREQGLTSKGISIGNNVWVGAKATFLDGSVVGNNSVVAAGAVVNSVFPDNVVIGGVPARILKQI